VWVEYREKQLVEELTGADRNSYIAIGFYPSMWPAGRKRHCSVEYLRRALEQGRIKSSGYRRHTPESLEEIPAAEWTYFVIWPPNVCFIGQTTQPWHRVRLLSADMRKLWRGVDEIDGRSKYDQAALREIYDALQSQNPEMSKNELIIELQGAYQDRFNKEPPSRTTIQRKIKIWS
jgi:hypothetical protein